MYKYLGEIYLIISHVDKRYTGTAVTNGLLSLFIKGMSSGSGDQADSSLAAQLIDDDKDAVLEAWKDSMVDQIKNNMDHDNKPDLPVIMVDRVCSK